MFCGRLKLTGHIAEASEAEMHLITSPLQFVYRGVDFKSEINRSKLEYKK